MRIIFFRSGFITFALKVKYPNFMCLIRGHYEDRNINEIYWLGEEYKELLNDEIDKKIVFLI